MKSSFFERLKQRWGISSNLSVVLILIVFALTGSSSVKLARPVLDFIGLHKADFEAAWYALTTYWILRILVIFPIYQILLVCFGWLFGQFSFFWNFEKKMLKRMGLGFLFK